MPDSGQDVLGDRAHDVAPRAHPNDGRFDVVEVSAAMPARARLQAWRRLATGTHVPHPDITTRRGVDDVTDAELGRALRAISA